MYIHKFDKKNESLLTTFGTNQSLLKRTFGFWFLFCLVLGLGSMGALAYVAIHFLAKVW